MAQTLLITPSEVVAECFTFTNTDTSLVKNTHIEAAQINSIKPILGQELYDQIISHKATNSLTANEITLVNDYIKIPLKWYSYANCLINIYNQTGSGGIVNHKEEFGSQVGSSGFNLTQSEANRIGDTYRDVLKKYLDDNYTLFPLYKKATFVKSFGIIID